MNLGRKKKLDRLAAIHFSWDDCVYCLLMYVLSFGTEYPALLTILCEQSVYSI
jgi:hypothetical protein